MLELPDPIYAMVATVIVTDLSPSETRRLGVARLLGTVLGGLLGALFSSLFESGAWSMALGIFLAMEISDLLGLKDAARVAGYVCGIVLLNHGDGPWHYAFYRTIETVLGIVFAVAVSLLPKLIKINEDE